MNQRLHQVIMAAPTKFLTAVPSLMRTSLGGCRISSRRAGLALSLPSIAARGCINLCHICTRNSHTINRPMKEKDQPVNELYEDPALNVIPEREEYEEVWFHIRGYDFVQVESYLKFLRKFINSVKLPSDQLAMPPRSWTIMTYKANSEIKDSEYQLRKFHRILKVSNLPNNILSLVADMTTRHLPAGVELSLAEPDEDLIEFRYIPDGDVKALQDAVYDLENPRLKKKKGH